MYIKSSPEVKTPISFQNRITLERLMIDGNLDIRYVMEVDLKRWRDNVTYVGEDVITGKIFIKIAIVFQDSGDFFAQRRDTK